MKKFFTLGLLALIFEAGCSAGVVNSDDVERHLTSIIGNKYDPLIGWGHGWNTIYENDKILELEFVKSKNCAYSIKINKLSNRVESWRFTLPRSGCDGYYAPSL